MSPHKNALRQRNNAAKESPQDEDPSAPQQPPHDEVVWGKTPSGEGISTFYFQTWWCFYIRAQYFVSQRHMMY
jgi:hypothetical protein